MQKLLFRPLANFKNPFDAAICQGGAHCGGHTHCVTPSITSELMKVRPNRADTLNFLQRKCI